MSKDPQRVHERIPEERHSSDSATRDRPDGRPKRRKRDEKNEKVHASESDIPVVITTIDDSSPAKSPPKSVSEIFSYPLVCTKCTFINRPSQAPGLPLPTACAVCLEPIQTSNPGTSSAECSMSEVSAGEVLSKSITAKCPTCTVILMDGINATVCYVCGSLLAPLSQSEMMKNLPLEEWWECSTCTLRNGPRTTVCGACETPLANINKGRAGTNVAIPPDGDRVSTGIVIPTVEELTSRTKAEAGDAQAATKGLIPRLHQRLIDKHGECMEVPRTGRGGGGLAWRSSSLDGRKEQAEWSLCDSRTTHCTQRGFQGSEFSCGYRNIQMLCSALMEWPEYRRVLFGGSGFVPRVLLLQCWIERAWADGFDPEGCEQLGGPGTLMGSEKWIGATECAALLRSFGVKADVIDFESSAASLETSEQVGIENAPAGGNYHSLCAHEGLGPPLIALRRHRLGSSPLNLRSCFQQQHQQSIRSCFVSPDTVKGTGRHGSDKSKIISKPAGGGCLSTGAGLRLDGYRRLEPRKGTPRPADYNFSGGVGSATCPWRTNSRALGGGRWRGGSIGGRGERWGKDTGRKAGQRMGRAIVEWTWEYFCTSWGDAEVLADDVVGEGGLPIAVGGQTKRLKSENPPAAQARSPPPLYFQHDGHSRSIVGVLLPGGAGQVADQGSRGRCQAGAGAGRSTENKARGRVGRGGGGGKGGIHPRRPGSLLVFDPSQHGSDISRALDGEGTKRSWNSMLKRGENTLHRRQFQVVAVRPGLIEAGRVSGWKKLVSSKISVE